MKRIDFSKILYHPETLINYKETGRINPYHMSIGFISKCNHNCRWCYIDYAKQGIAIDRETLLNALREAHEQWGLKAVTIVGMGEPTLHPDFVKLIHGIRDIGLETGLFTNGSRLTGDIAQSLLTATFVRVSLDAATPEIHHCCHQTNDFREIVKNIENFVRLRGKLKLPTIGIQFAACHLNKNDIIKMAELAVDLGVDYLSYKPVYKNKHNPDHPQNELDLNEARQLLGKAKEIAAGRLEVYTKVKQFHDVLGEDEDRPYSKCRAHSISPYIEEDGAVAFCGNIYPDSIIGNINKNFLAEIWYGEKHCQAIADINMKNCVKGCKYHRLNMILEGFFVDNPDLHMNFI